MNDDNSNNENENDSSNKPSDTSENVQFTEEEKRHAELVLNDEDDILIEIESDKDKTQKKHKTFHQILKSVFSIKDDVASHEEIRARIMAGGRITGTNAVILICAIIIASAGLYTSSTAAIIGAMLISPLMGTIIAIAYGVVSIDFKAIKSSAKGLLFQFLVALTISTLFFLISPKIPPTPELLARTNPTVYDVLIALFGGIAGIVASTREEKYSNVIPGVAIATALMPPICTMGYSLANGQWVMLYKSGFLLFINIYLIFAASAVVLSILDVPKVRGISIKQWKKLHFKMIRNVVIALIPALVFVVILLLGYI